jgi:hypothetical protein
MYRFISIRFLAALVGGIKPIAIALGFLALALPALAGPLMAGQMPLPNHRVFSSCPDFDQGDINYGANSVTVGNASELAEAVWAANYYGGAKEIILLDGVYTLDDMLWVETDGVTVYSQSGDREAVILEGHGMYGDVSHIFNVAGSNFTARDLTLRNVANHAVQTQPVADSITLSNLHILDTGEQMVKVAFDFSQPEIHTDGGIMENCLLEYSLGVGPQYYIGGIDAHAAHDWVVRGNTFIGIQSPSDSVAEHAIHFWSGSTNTLVENNIVINCDRGIGFGLGYRGHFGGIIRGNQIYHDAIGEFADVGIGLESASGAQVYDNIIRMEQAYPNAIEYRFPETFDVAIYNNTVNRNIVSRDGGMAEVYGNRYDSLSGWYPVWDEEQDWTWLEPWNRLEGGH